KLGSSAAGSWTSRTSRTPSLPSTTNSTTGISMRSRAWTTPPARCLLAGSGSVWRIPCHSARSLSGKPAPRDAFTVESSSRQKLHIIVTCTERKTAKGPERLRLRDIPDGEPWERASNWVERLAAEVTTPALPASELYAGEHWTRAKALPGLAVSTRAHLWTCSAGYGLIPAAASI